MATWPGTTAGGTAIWAGANERGGANVRGNPPAAWNPPVRPPLSADCAGAIEMQIATATAHTGTRLNMTHSNFVSAPQEDSSHSGDFQSGLPKPREMVI